MTTGDFPGRPVVKSSSGPLPAQEVRGSQNRKVVTNSIIKILDFLISTPISVTT